MDREHERDGQQEIIDEALREMGFGDSERPGPGEVNLAEFARLTGMTRSKARTLASRGFRALPHAALGRKAASTVISGFSGVVDGLLAKGVTNSEVILGRIRELGYAGGLTTVKNYVAANRHLVPARRRLAVEPQGSRGRRYETGPGEAYQMDWGFVDAVDRAGAKARVACFCMVCHHCGTCYVEFFPSARQENLLVGMLHAFCLMGVPARVLTDNMKSVVVRRDLDGRPVWQRDYAEFMSCVGFETRLCKPGHPFTKGKVERLVRFVKGNFVAGRSFADLTDMNEQALAWCRAQAARFHGALGLVPEEEHASCLEACGDVDLDGPAALYLYPLRRISFDGFVSFEGRRFGVPYWHEGQTCRVGRSGGEVRVYTEDLSRELACHPVTWSRRDSVCEDQWADVRPAELPTAPVAHSVEIAGPEPSPAGFEKFDFGRGL